MWQQSLQGEPYPDWIRTHFSEPLALTEIVLEPDASGVQVGSSYAYLTPRDWARMGQLWLDAWHGRSEVLAQHGNASPSRRGLRRAVRSTASGFGSIPKTGPSPVRRRTLFMPAAIQVNSLW